MSILVGNTKYTNISPLMTANDKPTPYVVECSIIAVNPFWKVFDGSDTTYFRSNISTVTPFTISLDYGEGNEQLVGAYRLVCTYNTAWSMKSWTFEGSNDNTVWDVLDTRSDISWDTNNTQDFTFSNLTKYRYYRFNVLEKNGTNSVCINKVMFLQEESANIEFRKVLKANLPSKKLDGIDTIYFTEDGDIFITDKKGNLIPSGVTHISSEELNMLSMKADGLYVAPTPVKNDGDGSLYLADDGEYKKAIPTTLSSDDCRNLIGNLWSEAQETIEDEDTDVVSTKNLQDIMKDNNSLINDKISLLTQVATSEDCVEMSENLAKILKRE